MKVKLITVCTNPIDAGLQQLKKSLDKHNWDYEVLIAPEWKGFGTKLITVYNYLKNSDVDAIFFCDAYDCVALGTMDEALLKIATNYGLDKIVCNSEKGCWPDGELERYYPQIYTHGFNYLNSGAYFTTKDNFIKLFEHDIPEYYTDDQLWMSHNYLFNENSNIVLDNSQIIFNCHSFIAPNEYTYENNRMQILENQSVLVHFNGRSPRTEVDNLI